MNRWLRYTMRALWFGYAAWLAIRIVTNWDEQMARALLLFGTAIAGCFALVAVTQHAVWLIARWHYKAQAWPWNWRLLTLWGEPYTKWRPQAPWSVRVRLSDGDLSNRIPVRYIGCRRGIHHWQGLFILPPGTSPKSVNVYGLPPRTTVGVSIIESSTSTL